MKNYVLGYIVNKDNNAIILLKKGKGRLHESCWNAIGGHVEDGETAIAAMTREGKEEAAFSGDWIHVGYIRGEAKDGPWTVFVYVARAKKEPHKEHDEITADWANNADEETPYWVTLGELNDLMVAPHVRALAYASLDKLNHPKICLVQLSEIHV